MFNDNTQNKDYLIYYLMKKLLIKKENDKYFIAFNNNFFTKDEYNFIIDFFLDNDFIDAVMEKTDETIKLYINNKGFRYLSNYTNKS